MPGIKNFSINKKKTVWKKFLAGAVALFILLFILNTFVSPVKNVFYAITSPISKVFLVAGESSSLFFGSVFNGVFLSKENYILQQENQKLLSQITALQSIVQGNQAQSDVSATCQNSGFKLVMAGVTGLDGNDIISINKGYANGIIENMPVISQQGVVFGRVIKSYKNYSQVMLISSKNSVVNVKVQNVDLSSEVDGVVKGKGGMKVYLDLVPISDNIEKDNILVTSSLEKFFPKDLLIGKITHVQKDDQKPFQQAEIELFFNIKTADNLFVITNYKR
jgi:rod shape-determining protein MreC